MAIDANSYGEARKAIALTERLTKSGAAWWSKVFAAPADSPTITVATSSQITGTVVTPTASYDYDPIFRYDGCHAVTVDGAGAYASTYPELLVPETVTDAQDLEYRFVAATTGTGTLGIRVIVDGKLTSLAMPRFDAVAGNAYYVRLHFGATKVKNVRVAANGSSRFVSLEATTYSVLQRPLGTPRSRFAVIGDSLQMGSPTFHYLGWESHSFFQSILMGCDSYINLGIGGTGWSDVAPGSDFGARIVTALACSPHILAFFGSRNDNSRYTQVLAAAMAGLAQVESVPVVLVCGPQQGTSFTVLNDLVRQSTIASGRTWIDLLGIAQDYTLDATGHPTFDEQLALARAAHAQVDMSAIIAAVAGANAARPGSTIAVATTPATAATAGSSVTITATVTSPLSTAGTVQFYDNGVALGSPVTVTGGTASYTTSALSTALHSITAKFRPTNPNTVKPSTSAAVSLNVSANLGVSDDFNRADGPVGNSLNGKAWDTTFPGWAIISNQVGNPSPTGSTYLPIDCGVLVGTYEFTWGGAYYQDARFYLAYQNNLNHIILNNISGTWRLWTNIAGTSAVMATGSANAWVAGDAMQIVVTQGSSPTKFTFVVKKNGTTVVTATDYDIGVLAANTKLAFGVNASGGAVRFDNVVMTP
ncbi:Ig-like domain-containing protein [Mycolicibacterium fluoranthenivorans]|uniref:Ig-like domain (Group 3) n=1 Tax=Mycolicibacterium fluoranthenivorans TaxID=258505 RepID=A0A1G4VFM5_9MYCO|nr:Ig-like domain-containing protein [Mycolicibacterium fluoranthenivorans]SCX06087.1 Ig-like domain (group 3) [Mycolicibacterium fluoranthenivorans]